LRDPRKYCLNGKAFGLAAAMFAGCLAAASAADTGVCSAARSPSNFDYLVLASMADSPRLPAMAGYFNNTDK
jgi:hypothetical protein